MADDTSTTATPPKPKKSAAPLASPEDQLRAKFLKVSGFKSSDVDGYNPRGKTFVTTNGGKYALNKAGKVRIIHGPVYPNWQPEE